MNERIKQLAEQAEWFAGTEYNKQTMATFHTNKSAEELFKEKFAELIVKECADAAYQSLYEDRVFDDSPMNIRLKVMDAIKKHFGVK